MKKVLYLLTAIYYLTVIAVLVFTPVTVIQLAQVSVWVYTVWMVGCVYVGERRIKARIATQTHKNI